MRALSILLLSLLSLSAAEPTDYSGLQLWLAHTNLADGAVATWADQSGNGNDFSQATGANQPVKSLSGVAFDGTNDSLRRDALASLFGGQDPQYTLFVVAAPGATGAERDLIGAGNATDNNHWNLHFFSTSGYMYNSRRASVSEASTTASKSTLETVGTTKVFTWRAKQRAMSMWANGVLRVDEAARDNGSVSANRLAIGCFPRGASEDFFNGTIKEIVVFNRALSLTEKQEIEAYLAAKHGLTVTTLPVHEVSIVRDAVQNHYQHPNVVTWSNRVYAGAVSSSGSGVLAVFDGTNTADRIGMMKFATGDDHNTWPILVRAGKPPIAFLTDHSGQERLYWRIGAAEGDFVNWGPLKSTAVYGVEYAQVWSRPGTDEIYVWCRQYLTNWSVFKSTNWGQTFAAPFACFKFPEPVGSSLTGQGYIRSVQLDDGTLRFTLGGHQTSSEDQSIGYCEVNLVSGNITKSDGSIIGNLHTRANLPVGVHDMDVLYDDSGLNPITTGTGAMVSRAPNPEVSYSSWVGSTWGTNVYHTRSNGVWLTSHRSVYRRDLGGIISGGSDFPYDTQGGVVWALRREYLGSSQYITHLEQCVTTNYGVSWTATLIATSGTNHFWTKPVGLRYTDPYQLVMTDILTYDGYFTYTGDLLAVNFDAGNPEPPPPPDPLPQPTDRHLRGNVSALRGNAAALRGTP